MNYFDAHSHILQDANNQLINHSFLDYEIATKYCSLGIHPWFITENWASELEQLTILAKNSNCIAIGECGLDRGITADFELQKLIFKQQLEIAKTLQRPVIIHCVRAYDEIMMLCKPFLNQVPMVIHGFNKNEKLGKQLLKQGFYVSLGQRFLTKAKLHELVKNEKLGQFFFETDNDLFQIKDLYQKASDLLGVSIEEVVNQINKNKEKVFFKHG